MLHFLKHYLTAFFDFVYRCGLEKGPCIWIIFLMKCSSHVGSSYGGKSYNGGLWEKIYRSGPIWVNKS